VKERSPYERWPYPERYPCSPTCTHDDANNAGHPERVTATSQAFSRIVVPPAPGESVVVNGPIARSASASEVYQDGVDETREAIRVSVLATLQHFGLDGSPLRNALMAAIEDAGKDTLL